jgi:hypothetical protein
MLRQPDCLQSLGQLLPCEVLAHTTVLLVVLPVAAAAAAGAAVRSLPTV